MEENETKIRKEKNKLNRRKRKIILGIVAIIGCVLSFVAGIAIGAGFIINQTLNRNKVNRAFHAYDKITISEMLREGEIEDAIKQLDRDAIYEFWKSSRKTWKPGPRDMSQWPTPVIKWWQEAKAYYKKYPEALQQDSQNFADVKELLEKIPELERRGTKNDFVRTYVGKIPPSLYISKWYGSAVTLENLRGKVVLLDFWGIWCKPCVARLPHTQKLYDKYNKMGLEILGIHSARKADSAKIADYLNKNNYTFLVGIDTGDTAANYAVRSWPTYYLIDKTGRLIWGPSSQPPPEKKIESLLRD